MRKTEGYTDENYDYIFKLMKKYKEKYTALKILNTQLIESMEGFLNSVHCEATDPVTYWKYEIGQRR